jgi:hypothetical protein
MAQFEYQASCQEEHDAVNRMGGAITGAAMIASGVIATSPKFELGNVSQIMDCCSMVKAALPIKLETVPEPLRSKFTDFMVECVKEDLEFHSQKFAQFKGEFGLSGDPEQDREKLDQVEQILRQRDKKFGYL